MLAFSTFAQQAVTLAPQKVVLDANATLPFALLYAGFSAQYWVWPDG